MSEPTPSPLETVDPESVTALFERDPSVVSDVDLDRLIAELRHRADTNAAEKAAAEAAPKSPRGRRKADPLLDAALAAIADKPTDELTLDDLGVPPGQEDSDGV